MLRVSTQEEIDVLVESCGRTGNTGKSSSLVLHLYGR